MKYGFIYFTSGPGPAGLAKIRITSRSVQTMQGELEWLLTPNLVTVS
jgi:hypothetical protein